MQDQMGQHQVEPNSSLGKAMLYLQRHWKALTLFLRQAGAPLDNNVCERALKKAVLHRKNALFYKTMNGAEAGDLFMTLIHTCELNNVNSFDYLVALLRNPEAVAAAPAAWMRGRSPRPPRDNTSWQPLHAPLPKAHQRSNHGRAADGEAHCPTESLRPVVERSTPPLDGP